VKVQTKSPIARTTLSFEMHPYLINMNCIEVHDIYILLICSKTITQGYLSLKQGSLFCFVTLRFPNHGASCPNLVIFPKALLMSRVASTWFETVWSYWLLNRLLNKNWIKLKLKTVLQFRGMLDVIGKPSVSQI